MSISGYQIGRMLMRLRQWHQGPKRSPAPSDRVVLSHAGESQSLTRPAAGAAFSDVLRQVARPIPPAVAEQRNHPAVVNEELERRAGSFMVPPYLPQPAVSRIPRIKRLPTNQEE